MKYIQSIILFTVLFAVDAVAQSNNVTKLDSASLISSDNIFLFVDSVAMPVGGYEPFYRYIYESSLS